MLIIAFKNTNFCFFIITVVIIIIKFVIIIIIVSISAGNKTRPNKLSSLQLQEQTDGHDQDDVNLRSLLKETNSRLFVKVANTMTMRMPIESHDPPSTSESS